jgi:multidrug efflux pump subunit AcrA (membrane-fusion protein)
MRRFSSGATIWLCLAIMIIPASPLLAQRGGGPGGGGARASGGGAAVATARRDERSHVISVAGRLEPRSRVVHSIPSAGFVADVLVREGEAVAAGDTLLTVRRRDDVLELYQPVPLTARVSGRVAGIHVDPAAEVQTGDAAVVILGADGYVIEALVTDKDAFRVALGQTVSGRTPDGTGVTATLLARSQEPDYATGLFAITFAVPATRSVRLGEFVLIDLPLDRVEGVFVPRDAIVRRFGRDTVWVVTAEDGLESRLVEIGDTFDEEIHIREGLVPGERYLPAPTGREREGAPVVQGNE